MCVENWYEAKYFANSQQQTPQPVGLTYLKLKLELAGRRLKAFLFAEIVSFGKDYILCYCFINRSF